jgi:predicted  nucleic acid-binding Zn-ribbon protein
MVKNVKEQIDIFVALQDIETQRSKIKIDLDNTSKKIIAIDSELIEFEKKMKEDELFINELNKEYRSYESDLETNQAHLRKSQEKLENVKNNKEYQSILKEMDDIKFKNSQIEDKMIECLNNIEEAENKIGSIRIEYSRISEKNKNEKEDIYKQIEQREKRLEELQKEWESISQSTESDLMNHYIELKGKIKGSVIASVKDAVCDGCHMNIPPQMYNELQRFDSLKYCPFCHRIIYWKV